MTFVSGQGTTHRSVLRIVANLAMAIPNQFHLRLFVGVGYLVVLSGMLFVCAAVPQLANSAPLLPLSTVPTLEHTFSPEKLAAMPSPIQLAVFIVEFMFPAALLTCAVLGSLRHCWALAFATALLSINLLPELPHASLGNAVSAGMSAIVVLQAVFACRSLNRIEFERFAAQRPVDRHGTPANHRTPTATDAALPAAVRNLSREAYRLHQGAQPIRLAAARHAPAVTPTLAPIRLPPRTADEGWDVQLPSGRRAAIMEFVGSLDMQNTEIGRKHR